MSAPSDRKRFRGKALRGSSCFVFFRDANQPWAAREKAFKVMQALLVAVLCAAAPTLAQQEEGGTGIVYGTDHAFVVKAPPGWVLDNQAAAEHGIHAVFYPVGSSWADSPVVMYVNTANKEREGITDAEGLIAIDLARLRKESPGVISEAAPPLKTGDGRVALVRRFSGDKFGNTEAVAYIDVSKTVIMLVLTSRSPTLFESSQSAFETLVKSVHYLTDKVRIEKRD